MIRTTGELFMLKYFVKVMNQPVQRVRWFESTIGL